MGYHKIIRLSLLLLLALALVGCQKMLRKTEPAATHKPGEEPVASYRKTVKKHRCEKGETSIFLENSTFSPVKVAAGERILNRFVYACCARRGLSGTITRQVLLKGKVILKDDTNFTFAPGTWAVTAYVQVPPNASPGSYVFELILKAGKQVVKEKYTFQVLKP